MPSAVFDPHPDTSQRGFERREVYCHMQVALEELPRMGDIQLTIQVSARFNYSARAAQRMAGRFAADEISYLLRVGEPTLAVKDRLFWRVPLTLSYPDTGSVGEVGAVDVDVETGQIMMTPEKMNQLIDSARFLASTHATIDRFAS